MTRVAPAGDSCSTAARLPDSNVRVGLYAPARPGDQERLDGWCAAVGPAVLDSVPDGRFGPWPAGDSLAVLTWNVNGGSGDIAAFLREQVGVSCEDGASVGGPAPRPFVLLIQEAYRRSADVPAAPAGTALPPKIKEDARPGSRIDILTVARDCGLSLAYVPSKRNGPQEFDGEREDLGTALLSDLPLSDVIAIQLPFEVSRRVAIAATVHGPGGDSLRAVSAHLDVSPGPWRLLSTANTSRLRQAMGLVDALQDIEVGSSGTAAAPATGSCARPCRHREAMRHPIATVLAGDFNTPSAGETTLKHLHESFPDSPRWDGQPSRGIFPADHILFRAGGDMSLMPIPGSYRRLEDPHYSDHRARIIWLRSRGGTVAEASASPLPGAR